MTGPDEYSAIADNNLYTNLMAQRNLRLAADVVERHPDRAAQLGVDDEEASAWRDAAQAILIPFDEQLGVHPQAEGFTCTQAVIAAEVGHLGLAYDYFAEGPTLELTHHGHAIDVTNPEPVSCPIPEIAVSEATTQPVGRTPAPRAAQAESASTG